MIIGASVTAFLLLWWTIFYSGALLSLCFRACGQKNFPSRRNTCHLSGWSECMSLA